MALTQQQQAEAQRLGLDLTNIDWTKVVSIIRLLVELFSQRSEEETVKAAGCPDAMVNLACHCCEAGQLALDSAALSFECCRECCHDHEATP